MVEDAEEGLREDGDGDGGGGGGLRRDLRGGEGSCEVEEVTGGHDRGLKGSALELLTSDGEVCSGNRMFLRFNMPRFL